MAYFYFHSIMRYGIIFWGNATNSCKVFRFQKRVIRIIFGAEPRASCRGLLRKYIPSLMLFITDNPNNCQTGLEIHGLHTRSKIHLSIPIANLMSVQKGITYSGTKIYTGCNRRNGPDFGRVFLRSNYTDITQNTYIQS